MKRGVGGVGDDVGVESTNVPATFASLDPNTFGVPGSRAFVGVAGARAASAEDGSVRPTSVDPAPVDTAPVDTDALDALDARRR